MLPTQAQVVQLRRDNKGQSVRLSNVPPEQWPPDDMRPNCRGRRRPRLAVWRNRRFLVQAFDEGAGIVRLSVCRTDWDERAGRWKEGISWDDLQQLKSEAGYADSFAVEVYPAEFDVVNVANMRHLFVLPEPPTYAWRNTP